MNILIQETEITKTPPTKETKILFHEGNPFNIRCQNCERGLYARYMLYKVDTDEMYVVCEFCKNDIEFLESISSSNYNYS